MATVALRGEDDVGARLLGEDLPPALEERDEVLTRLGAEKSNLANGILSVCYAVHQTSSVVIGRVRCVCKVCPARAHLARARHWRPVPERVAHVARLVDDENGSVLIPCVRVVSELPAVKARRKLSVVIWGVGRRRP